MVHRRILAAVAAGAAVLIVASSLHAPHTGASATVCVASQRIPGGTTLTAGLLTVTEVPTGLVPTGAITSADQVSGRMTGGPIAAGSILTEDDLVDPSQAEPGHVIIPLQVSTHLLALIRPGDHVSVFLTGADGQVSVSRGLRVVTVPAGDNSGFLSSNTADTILVEVPEDIASQLSASSGLNPPQVAIE